METSSGFHMSFRICAPQITHEGNAQQEFPFSGLIVQRQSFPVDLCTLENQCDHVPQFSLLLSRVREQACHLLLALMFLLAVMFLVHVIKVHLKDRRGARVALVANGRAEEPDKLAPFCAVKACSRRKKKLKRKRNRKHIVRV